MADSIYHFQCAESVLEAIAAEGAAQETDPTRLRTSPQTYELWLRAAEVHAQLAAIALTAEKTIGAVEVQAWTTTLYPVGERATA
jgi:hypothetical protein